MYFELRGLAISYNNLTLKKGKRKKEEERSKASVRVITQRPIILMEIDLEKYEINTFLWYTSYKQSLSAGIVSTP